MLYSYEMKNKKKTTGQKLTLVDAYSEAFAAGVAFATANERAAALNNLRSRSGFIGVPDPTI